MDKEQLYEQLRSKDRNLKNIADKTADNKGIIKHLIDGLGENNADVKFGSSNTLIIISERYPEFLYPFFDFFTDELGNKNNFIKWGSLSIIANLTKIDEERKFDRIFSRYFSEIAGPVMITAANIIKGAAVIAVYKPYLTGKITNELLKISDGIYQTSECKNIVLGHMVSAFDKFFQQVENKKDVLVLIEKQADNPRNATAKKAQKFIKKWVK